MSGKTQWNIPFNCNTWKQANYPFFVRDLCVWKVFLRLLPSEYENKNILWKPVPLGPVWPRSRTEWAFQACMRTELQKLCFTGDIHWTCGNACIGHNSLSLGLLVVKNNELAYSRAFNSSFICINQQVKLFMAWSKALWAVNVCTSSGWARWCYGDSLTSSQLDLSVNLVLKYS